MAATFERHVDVHVPVGEAFERWWRSFEAGDLSEDVDSVEPAGPQLYRWRAHIAGIEEEWIAEVTELIPGRRIAWTSRSGASNAGCVTFHRLGDRHARVMLKLQFDPDGWLETLGAWIGLVDWRVEAALEAFKLHLESDAAARSARSRYARRYRQPRHGRPDASSSATTGR